MTQTRLATIEEQLVAELSHIDARLNELDLERNAAIKDRERAVACLDALGVKQKSRKSSSRRPARQCASQKEVAAAITELISANGPMAEDDLARLAKSRVSESGKSLVGFGLRFAEVRENMLHEVSPGLLALRPARARTVVND